MKIGCMIISQALAAGLLLSACSTPSAEKTGSTIARSDTKKSGSAFSRWFDKGYKRNEPYSHGSGKIRKGPGLFTGKDGAYTLYRSGETGSADPDKPKKLKR